MTPELTRSLLDQPPSIPLLRRLLAAGALTPREVATLEARVRRELPWQSWLDRALLSLGAVLILSGIGYFFAHNWDHLTDADKLGLAGGAILVSLAGATWAGFDRFTGKILLLAASALVGVFLAVFGQVYQTGAEMAGFFSAWAFLIVPWVVLGRFMPLWMAWIALLNLAVGFYWPVAHAPFDFFFFGSDQIFREVTISLALLNGAALLLRELAERWRQDWFDRGWSIHLLLAALLIPAGTETVADIIESWDAGAHNDPAVIAVLLHAALTLGLGFYYSRVRHALPALALVTLSACTILTVITLRLIIAGMHEPDAGVLLLGGIIVLGIFGAGVLFLRAQRLAHPSQP